LSAMGECHQFTSNTGVATYDDCTTIASDVPDSGGMNQDGAVLQYASRAAEKALEQKMEIHVIDCT
jgi:hypothetical protein